MGAKRRVYGWGLAARECGRYSSLRSLTRVGLALTVIAFTYSSTASVAGASSAGPGLSPDSNSTRGEYGTAPVLPAGDIKPVKTLSVKSSPEFVSNDPLTATFTFRITGRTPGW